MAISWSRDVMIVGSLHAVADWEKKNAGKILILEAIGYINGPLYNIMIMFILFFCKLNLPFEFFNILVNWYNRQNKITIVNLLVGLHLK